MKKVFIDGKAGTTGLRIYERLAARDDLALLTLSDEDRKNTEKRCEMLNNADIAFLCLPDAAAKEAADMVINPDTTVIDTSTAHRTAPGWLYGFPELCEKKYEEIRQSKRISVPGCHASGFIALVKPLTDAGILPFSAKLSCHSVTGYSGGGKIMIAQYETEVRNEELSAPRQYGLNQEHKHLREMKIMCGLENEPLFCPIVSDFYSGMLVTVPIFTSELCGGAGADEIRDVYRSLYGGPVVCYRESLGCDGMISASSLRGKDRMEITVAGNSERILLMALYDNLGKGASGAAVENMNIVLGTDITCGLVL